MLAWIVFANRWQGMEIAIRSAAVSNPSAELQIAVPAEENETRVPSKLKEYMIRLPATLQCPSCWVTRLACMQRALLASAKGRRVVLLEADQFISGSLSPAFSMPRGDFDVGLTFRDLSAHGPINSGVMVINGVSDRVLNFFTLYIQTTETRFGGRCWSGDNQHALAELSGGFLGYGTIRRPVRPRGLQRAATDVWDASGDCLRLLSLPCSEYNVAFKQSRCNHPALLMHRTSGGDGGPVHGSGQRLAQRVPRIFHFMGSNKAFQARCEATLKNFSASMASR